MSWIFHPALFLDCTCVCVLASVGFSCSSGLQVNMWIWELDWQILHKLIQVVIIIIFQKIYIYHEFTNNILINFFLLLYCHFYILHHEICLCTSWCYCMWSVFFTVLTHFFFAVHLNSPAIFLKNKCLTIYLSQINMYNNSKRMRKIVFDEVMHVTLLSQHNIYLTTTIKYNKRYMIYCCLKRNDKVVFGLGSLVCTLGTFWGSFVIIFSDIL